MQHITLRQIAVKAGLSVMGVSKALRNSREISEATKIRVRKIAEQMGYRPNRIASILSSGKTKIIGVLLPNFYGHHWDSLLDSIGSELRVYGYSMLPLRWSKVFNTDINDIKELLTFRPDGLIVSPRFQNGEAAKFYTDLVKEDLKIVFLSSFPQIEGISRVCSDEESGITKALEYLVSMGHKNILYIGASFYSKKDDQRLQGFLNAVKSIRTKINKFDVIWRSQAEESDLVPEVLKFIKNKHMFTAAICGSDYLAMDIMLAIPANKRSKAIAFSAIGFGDVFPSTSYLKYPLTTISHKPQLIGTVAVKKLLAMIEKKEQPNDIVVPTELIIRASVQDLRQK
jgi:LacI family transcriptional regulator